MAKQQDDRTTIDLFATEKRPGRPKTSPLPRRQQLLINKRNQLRRDRSKGLRRIECKIHEDLLVRLNAEAKKQSVSRSELIEKILRDTLLTANH